MPFASDWMTGVDGKGRDVALRYVIWNLSVTSRALLGPFAAFWIAVAAALTLVGSDLPASLTFGIAILASFAAGLFAIVFLSSRLKVEASSGIIKIYSFAGCTRVQSDLIHEINAVSRWFLPEPVSSVTWLRDGTITKTPIYALPFRKVGRLLDIIEKPSDWTQGSLE